nr:MAG: hypothetical protein E4H34_06505 [Hyphomicrobiales bacterium]
MKRGRWKSFALAAVPLVTHSFAPAAAAQGAPTFDRLWAEARQNPECIRADFDDFILVNCAEQLTLWYFTMANHPAHPAVIKRELKLEEGALVSQIDGDFFGPQTALSGGQSAGGRAFQSWLAEIRDLDRQMRETMGGAADAPPGPSVD